MMGVHYGCVSRERTVLTLADGWLVIYGTSGAVVVLFCVAPQVLWVIIVDQLTDWWMEGVAGTGFCT